MGSRPPGVTWHLALWSPDFPPCIRRATAWPTPGRQYRSIAPLRHGPAASDTSCPRPGPADTAEQPAQQAVAGIVAPQAGDQAGLPAQPHLMLEALQPAVERIDHQAAPQRPPGAFALAKPVLRQRKVVEHLGVARLGDRGLATELYAAAVTQADPAQTVKGGVAVLEAIVDGRTRVGRAKVGQRSFEVIAAKTPEAIDEIMVQPVMAGPRIRIVHLLHTSPPDACSLNPASARHGLHIPSGKVKPFG